MSAGTGAVSSHWSEAGPAAVDSPGTVNRLHVNLHTCLPSTSAKSRPKAKEEGDLVQKSTSFRNTQIRL